MNSDLSPTLGAEQVATPARQVFTVHLQKIPLLAGIDSQCLTQVASALQLRSVERGHQVLQKGSAGEHLLFVLSGRLQAVDLTEDGREIGLSFLTAGDYFGELSIRRIIRGLFCDSSQLDMRLRVF